MAQVEELGEQRAGPAKRGAGASGADRLVKFAMPEVNEAADCRGAFAAVIRAVADGAITPGEATKIAKLVSEFAAIDNATEKQRRARDIQANGRAPAAIGRYLRSPKPIARGR